MVTDPLQCTYEDARRNHLRDGIAMSTRAKVEYFEEMVALVAHFGARDRLAVHEPESPPANARTSSPR